MPIKLFLVFGAENEILRSDDFSIDDRQTDDRQIDKTDCFFPCACSWGKYYYDQYRTLAVLQCTHSWANSVLCCVVTAWMECDHVYAGRAEDGM